MNKFYNKVLHQYKEKFTPANYDVHYHKHLQQGLFGMDNFAHVRMGLFYEMLTMAMFGGELFDSMHKTLEWKDFFSADRKIKPDVMDETNEIVYESKASKSGNHTNLLNRQLGCYETYLRLYPSYKLYYVFFRHNYNGIMKSKEYMQEMFRKLAYGTHAAISLPFSIILHLHKHEKYKKYSTDQWADSGCTVIGSKEMNRFYFEPEVVMPEIGLNLDDYIIHRYFLGMGIRVMDECVHPFPFVHIIDKDYKKWYTEVFDAVPF